MRVVHVVRQYHPSIGGLEEVVRQLAREQRALGYEVGIVTLDRQFRRPGERLPARETIDGIPVVRLPYAGSSRYPIAPRVLGAIAKADLVHVHAIDFFFDFLALTTWLHGKPLVATTHGGFFHTRTHAAAKRVWFKTATRWSAGHYGALVACSRSDLAIFQPIAPDGVRLIENGVDIGKFAGASSPSAAKSIVTIGRFSANKRLDNLLDTMQALTARDPAWRLAIIGTPSDWSAERLAAEIATRRLTPHVDVHLSPDNAAIRQALGTASLFASASEHEGFGLVLVEALSAGLLPVVQDNAAFRTLVSRLPLATLADFAVPARAADLLESSYRDLARHTAEFRAQAHARALPFSWPQVAARYGAVYGNVLDRGVGVFAARPSAS